MKIFSLFFCFITIVAVGQTKVGLRDLQFTLPAGYTAISQEAYTDKFGELNYSQFHEAGAAFTAHETVNIKYQYYEVPGITERKLDSVFYDQEKRFRDDYSAKIIIHHDKKHYIYSVVNVANTNILYGYSVGSKGILHIQMMSKDTLPTTVFESMMDGITYKVPYYYDNQYEEHKGEGAESSKRFIIAGIIALVVYLLTRVVNKQKRASTK